MSKYQATTIFVEKIELILPIEEFGENARELIVINDTYATELRFFPDDLNIQVGKAYDFILSKHNALGHRCFIANKTTDMPFYERQAPVQKEYTPITSYEDDTLDQLFGLM